VVQKEQLLETENSTLKMEVDKLRKLSSDNKKKAQFAQKVAENMNEQCKESRTEAHNLKRELEVSSQSLEESLHEISAMGKQIRCFIG